MYFCAPRRNGRAVECGGLENRCPPYRGPGVRIPLPPQKKLNPPAKPGDFTFGAAQALLEACPKSKIPRLRQGI